MQVANPFPTANYDLSGVIVRRRRNVSPFVAQCNDDRYPTGEEAKRYCISRGRCYQDMLAKANLGLDPKFFHIAKRMDGSYRLIKTQSGSNLRFTSQAQLHAYVLRVHW